MQLFTEWETITCRLRYVLGSWSNTPSRCLFYKQNIQNNACQSSISHYFMSPKYTLNVCVIISHLDKSCIMPLIHYLSMSMSSLLGTSTKSAEQIVPCAPKPYQISHADSRGLLLFYILYCRLFPFFSMTYRGRLDNGKFLFHGCLFLIKLASKVR